MKTRSHGRNGLAGLKIDISKAYDKLECGYVTNMLKRYGFSGVWIDRIIGLIASFSYNFLHNGEVFQSTIAQRGLRQGDPISPYLYILCVEGLNAIVLHNEEADLLYGCTIARGAPTISHLLCANDCYLFFRANGNETKVMKRILIRYEHISG